MSRTTLIVALSVVVVVHALLLWVYYVPEAKSLWGDEISYARVARALSQGRNGELDLLWPPLYPHFVGRVLRFGGGSLLAVQLAQLALLVGIALLARDIWRRLIDQGPAGDWVAFSFLAYPPLAAYAYYLWPEILHLALLMLALWILVARRSRVAWLALLGLVLGLALLTKSILGPFVPILLIPVLLDGPIRHTLPRLALVGVVLLVTVMPTMITNQRRHGVFAVASSGPFNLWVGLNDTSRVTFDGEIVGREYRTYRDSADSVVERNEIVLQKIVNRVRRLGPIAILRGQLSRQYFRLFEKESFLTQQLPGGAIAARGFGYRGTSPSVAALLRAASFASYTILLVAAAFGVALVPPGSSRRWIWIPLSFVLYNLAVFLLLHAKSRYRIQFLPVLILYAALAWQWWFARSDRLPVARLVLGGLLAALLVFLAFGGPWL